MHSIDFSTPSHIHFTGIGGISMSGLAEVLLNEGFTVSGSDNSRSPLTEHLKGLGANIYIGHSRQNISDDTRLLVYTAAVKQDNPELLCAAEKNIPVISRAELLGQLMKNYSSPVAVSGTHGKTTTTSMLSHILLEAHMDPTISVGGILKSIGGNIRVGNSGIFVTEACEYTNSFLHFSPYIGIILNIDADHLDFFKDLEDIRRSFKKFAMLIPKEGSLVINRDIENFESFVEGLQCHIITFGLHPQAEYTAGNIRHNSSGKASFDLICHGVVSNSVNLSVGGEHNVSNALAAIAASVCLGLTPVKASEGLSGFEGANRRFEYKGSFHGVSVIDDYAHHPSEINATLKAASMYPHNELWCIFQPHTYSRTSALFDEFVSSLSTGIDHLIITDIYAARETNTIGINIMDLVNALREKNPHVCYIRNFQEIAEFCRKNCRDGDMLITMGAGNVVDIGEHLLSP